MLDWDSKHYKEHARAQGESATKLVNGFALTGSEKILDIGCGDGKITRRMAERVPQGRVVGIDISPNMIREAHNCHSNVSNLSFFQKDALSFTLDEKFDLVTSFYALNWIKDQDSVLRNISLVLRKGGRLCFLIVCGTDPCVDEVFNRDPWREHIKSQLDRYPSFTDRAYRTLLEERGFQVDRMEVSKSIYSTVCRDLQAAVNHYMTWLPCYTALEGAHCLQLAYEIAENASIRQGRNKELLLGTPVLYVEAHLA